GDELSSVVTLVTPHRNRGPKQGRSRAGDQTADIPQAYQRLRREGTRTRTFLNHPDGRVIWRTLSSQLAPYTADPPTVTRSAIRTVPVPTRPTPPATRPGPIESDGRLSRAGGSAEMNRRRIPS